MSDVNDNGANITVVEGAQAATVTVDTGAAASEAAAAKEAADNPLIGGKFKTNEDLLAAYTALEKKMGGQAPAEEAEAEAPVVDDAPVKEDPAEPKADDAEASGYGTVVDNALTAAGVSVADVQKEFTDNDGKFTPETMDKFNAAGFPKEIVEAYLRGVVASNADAAVAQEAVAASAAEQISAVKALAGGDDGYAAMTKHMASTYTQTEADAFNAALNDPETAKAAVAEAHARYTKAVGVEPKLIGGKTPAAVSGYESEAQLLEDMAKPEYKTSAAFRDNVQKKLASSSQAVLGVR